MNNAALESLLLIFRDNNKHRLLPTACLGGSDFPIRDRGAL
jgi:hypothetical protein